MSNNFISVTSSQGTVIGTSAGGDLSGSFPNPTIASIQGVAISGTPLIGYTLIATSPTTAAWVAFPVQGTTLYYFNATSSDVSGDYAMTPTLSSTKTTANFSSLAAGNNLLQTWITASGVPNVGFIPAGVIDCHVHASSSVGSTGNYLYCEVWETNSTGTLLNLMGTTESGGLVTNAGETQYDLDLVLINPFILQSTSSRIACQVYCHSTGSPAVSMSLYYGGEADAHCALPTSV